MRREKVMLFPEGTRSVDGCLGRGNRAVGKLIYLAQPIVIPTAILGTDRLFAKGLSCCRDSFLSSRYALDLLST